MGVYTKKFLKFNTAKEGDILLSADSIDAFETTDFQMIESQPMSYVSCNAGWQREYRIYYVRPSVAEGTNDTVLVGHLVDSTATFITDGVQPGDIVGDGNSGAFTTVVAVNSETEIQITDNIFGTTGQPYYIYLDEYKMENAFVDGVQKAVSSKWREAIIDLEVPAGQTLIGVNI